MAGNLSPRAGATRPVSPYGSPYGSPFGSPTFGRSGSGEFSFSGQDSSSVSVDSEPGVFGGIPSPRHDRFQGNGDRVLKVSPSFSSWETTEQKKIGRRPGLLAAVLHGDMKEIWKRGFQGWKTPRLKQPAVSVSREQRLCQVSLPLAAVLLSCQVGLVMLVVSLWLCFDSGRSFDGTASRRALMGFLTGSSPEEDLTVHGSVPFRPPVCHPRPSFELPQQRRQLSEEELSEGVSDGSNVTDTAVTKLPLLIFTAGVEGCGHHYLEQVLRNIEGVKMTFTQYEPSLHLTSEDTQGDTGMGLGGSNCAKLPYSRLWSTFIREVAIRLGPVKDGIYVRARDSFPMGRVRTPLARPDLINLSLMDGIIYDLKVLVLVRNLTNAYTSAFRRGYHDGDLGLMARIMEDEMVYLDASIRTLPCGSYMALDFDMLVETPEEVAGAMAEFLDIGVDESAFLQAFKLATEKKPSHNTEPPEVAGDSIEDFFQRRSMMWPLLRACTAKKFFHPQNPFDWPVS